MKALIDGDIILYSSGFRSDYNAKKEGKEHEPLSYAIQNAKKMILNCLEKTGADEYQIYLTGSNNYREEIATVAVYKGNRDPAARPFWYKELKTYLVDKWDAIIINNEEADDALGINQTVDTIICSTDKDLDMIPGMHFNWRQQVIYEIDELTALRNFYKQLITGDKTDNIMGLSKKAPKRRTYKYQPIDSMKTEWEMYCYCFEGYALEYCDKAEEMLLENGRLLWIRQTPNQIWKVPNEN